MNDYVKSMKLSNNTQYETIFIVKVRLVEKRDPETTGLFSKKQCSVHAITSCSTENYHQNAEEYGEWESTEVASWLRSNGATPLQTERQIHAVVCGEDSFEVPVRRGK